MCGIAGILTLEGGPPPSEEVLVRMISTLAHRGPDGWGTYLSPHMALGHTRLSIVDLGRGHQPMRGDRCVIAYNGEVYNYLELGKELEGRGIRFRTSSDTEVVLKAFEYFGTDAFPKINGQFAFVIWDETQKKAVIARDRYGIRPLYALKHGCSYYFASEMKALDTIDDWERSINAENLFLHALLWNTLGDDTVYKDVRSVAAGTYEVYESGKAPEINRYYEIGESNGTSPKSIDAAKEEFVSLLCDSVNLRLRSDVPVGAYLSGGIDSSVVTYLTKGIKRERFKTFSVSFQDSEFDESRFQQEMVSSINSEHLDVNVRYRDINDNISDAVYHTERPVFRTAGVPLFLLSDAVYGSGIKVVLTGEGADELLYGYDSYKELRLLEFWRRFPDSRIRPQLIKRLYPHLRHYSDPKQFGMIKMYYESFLDSLDNELSGLNIRAHNNKALLNYLNKDIGLAFDKEALIERINNRDLPDNFRAWSLLQKNQFLEMKTLLSGYLLSSQGDRMSMAHSVEGRYPFLDHRIVEMLFYCDDDYKLKGLRQKHLLAEAFKDSLPESIVNRPKRPYMAPDLKSFFWEGRPSDLMLEFLSEDALKDSGVFEAKMVGRLLKKFSGGVPDNIGYRDNMLATFLLTCQLAAYWAKKPRLKPLAEAHRTVRLTDNRDT